MAFSFCPAVQWHVVFRDSPTKGEPHKEIGSGPLSTFRVPGYNLVQVKPLGGWPLHATSRVPSLLDSLGSSASFQIPFKTGQTGCIPNSRTSGLFPRGSHRVRMTLQHAQNAFDGLSVEGSYLWRDQNLL